MPAPKRQATVSTDAGDPNIELPLPIETNERHVERQPTLPAEEAPEQEQVGLSEFPQPIFLATPSLLDYLGSLQSLRTLKKGRQVHLREL
jgi:hypothetical protein